jgi:hypothetical protein
LQQGEWDQGWLKLKVLKQQRQQGQFPEPHPVLCCKNIKSTRKKKLNPIGLSNLAHNNIGCLVKSEPEINEQFLVNTHTKCGT